MDSIEIVSLEEVFKNDIVGFLLFVSILGLVVIGRLGWKKYVIF